MQRKAVQLKYLKYYDVFLSLKELCKDNKQKLDILIEIEKDFGEVINLGTVAVWFKTKY